MSAKPCPICKGTKLLAGYTSRPCGNCAGTGVERPINAEEVLSRSIGINGLTVWHLAQLDLRSPEQRAEDERRKAGER